MPSLPPELRVEIRKAGEQFPAVTKRAKTDLPPIKQHIARGRGKIG